jgi:hypothetical protein
MFCYFSVPEMNWGFLFIHLNESVKSASSNLSDLKMLSSAFCNFLLFSFPVLKINKNNQEERELDGPSHSSPSTLKPIILTKSSP